MDERVRRDARLLRAVAERYTVPGYRDYYRGVAERLEAGDEVLNVAETLREARRIARALGLTEESD